MVSVSWRNRVIAWPFSCFDTIGSPNAGYFTYDGDQSGQRNQNVAAGDVPGGSAGIERTLAGYLNLAGWRPADQPLGPGTDYFPFLTAGVPIGGMTTGATGKKTDVQARLWRGNAGQPVRPELPHPARHDRRRQPGSAGDHGPRGGLHHRYVAQSIDGVNGVPPRDRRHLPRP